MEIKKAIEKDFAEVHPMPWGYCLLQRGQSGSSCDSKDGPNVVDNSPGLCGSCRFFSMGVENQEIWQQVYLTHKEVVDSPLSTPLAKSASGKMISIAENFLAKFQDMTGSK